MSQYIFAASFRLSKFGIVKALSVSKEADTRPKNTKQGNTNNQEDEQKLVVTEMSSQENKQQVTITTKRHF